MSALFGFPLAGKCMKVGAEFMFSWRRGGRRGRKDTAYEKMSRKHKRRREGRRMMNRRETRAQKH